MARLKSKRLLRIPISKFPFTPSTYPGRRPRFSFLFIANGIYRLKFRRLGKLLESHGLPPASERYAILAYGSNACPGQLLKKKLTGVPVLYSRLTGAEAVYAGRQTTGGYVPATLARKKGSRSSWVTLLTEDQLTAMDRSEGRPDFYVLAEIPGVQFSLGRSRVTPLYSYVDIRGGVMTREGKPVSLRSTSQKRARSLLATTSGEDAAKWLDFVTIPNPNPPERFSQFIGR